MLVHQACGQTRELTKKNTQVEIKTDRFVINSKRDSHVEFIGLFFHDWKNRQKKTNQPTFINTAATWSGGGSAGMSMMEDT